MKTNLTAIIAIAAFAGALFAMTPARAEDDGFAPPLASQEYSKDFRGGPVWNGPNRYGNDPVRDWNDTPGYGMRDWNNTPGYGMRHGHRFHPRAGAGNTTFGPGFMMGYMAGLMADRRISPAERPWDGTYGCPGRFH